MWAYTSVKNSRIRPKKYETILGYEVDQNYQSISLVSYANVFTLI